MEYYGQRFFYNMIIFIMSFEGFKNVPTLDKKAFKGKVPSIIFYPYGNVGF